MSVYLIDHPPATRQYRSPRRAKPSGVCVVHTAESIADDNPPDRGAENVAAFIARRTNAGSYHDLADSDSDVQLVRYSDEAFHDATGSNPHSYGVSAATQAHRWPDLEDDYAAAMVRRMARCAARYATWVRAEHGVMVPARRISRAQSEARLPGFLSHAERDPARRTDPGPRFPWDLFLDTYAQLMEGDDMFNPAEHIRQIAEKVWHTRIHNPVLPEDTDGVEALTFVQSINSNAWRAVNGIRALAADPNLDPATKAAVARALNARTTKDLQPPGEGDPA